jgi:Uma2 family endonuclease
MELDIEMSTAALVSVEDYLHRTEKPYCEYLDGVLHPKQTPTLRHGFIQYLLMILLRKQGVQAFPEVAVRLSDTKFLIPDVIAARTIQGPYPTEPVLLCVEILSPTDRLVATLAKCELYHAWGVPFCWVIDPEKQTAWQYHAGGEPERVGHLGQSGILLAGELSVRTEELFSEPIR